MWYKIILFLGLVLLGSCGGPRPNNIDLDQWSLPSEKIKILSTTAMIDDLVGAIGGDRVIHVPLIVGEVDPHSYELVKGDGEKMSVADVIFYNGLGLEHGASLQGQLKTHAHAIALGEEILKRCPEKKIMDKRRVDPHVWMDISLWGEAIDPIMEALIERDPEGKEVYQTQAALLKKTMRQAHDEVYRLLQGIPQEKRYLVTSHDAFNYFTRAYLAEKEELILGTWKSRFEAPEGLSPDGQLSAADIQRVIDHLIHDHVQVVFAESNVSRDSLKKVINACAQKGLVVTLSKEVLYGDAMGDRESGASTYLGMIRQNASVLKKAWE